MLYYDCVLFVYLFVFFILLSFNCIFFLVFFNSLFFLFPFLLHKNMRKCCNIKKSENLRELVPPWNAKMNTKSYPLLKACLTKRKSTTERSASKILADFKQLLMTGSKPPIWRFMSCCDPEVLGVTRIYLNWEKGDIFIDKNKP